MPLDTTERLRLSVALFARGLVLFAFAAIGIRWPETTLFFVLVGAGASAAVLGVFQLGMHLAGRELPSTKAFLLGDGFTTLSLGILLISVPQLSGSLVLLFTGLWLLVYDVSVLLLAARVWYLAFVRRVLVAWGTVTLAVAIGALWSRPMPLADALYWVTAYLWCYGLLHVGAGLWLHRRHRIIMARTSPRHSRQPVPHVAAR
jgi:uncharacterized membrane protein HdeD (DUF308 family)